MIRAEQVRGALSSAQVLDHFGIDYKRSGDELRTRQCPKCGQRGREAVAINAATRAWIDHAHGCTGDVFALIAGYAGLDVARDFPDVVELGAEIAGLPLDGSLSPEVERKLAEVAARRRADAEREEVERKRVLATMPGRWNALARRSAVGERYLAGRGLDPVAPREVGDVVRYTPSGEPAVALRDLMSGAIVGIQYRQVNGDLKLALPRSQVAGSALWGRLTDLDPDGVDVAVLVEGIVDALAAHLVWPWCAIYGAPGAGQIAEVARAVAPRVVECRGWLLLAVDNDASGVTGSAAAINAAIDAGLVLDRDLHVVDLGEHHDLADAWANGWRWVWPS